MRALGKVQDVDLRWLSYHRPRLGAFTEDWISYEHNCVWHYSSMQTDQTNVAKYL